jgi:hypothetical protein
VKNRFNAVVGAALVGVAGIAACSSQPSDTPQKPGTLPPNTAQVTINGKDTGTTNALNCGQVDWFTTIDTGNKAAGASTMIQTGDTITAKSVEIRDLGGFSGTYWEGNNGNADAGIDGNTYIVSGTINGFNTDNPTKPATATFKIKANC